MIPTYNDFVFRQARIVARAWLSVNPIDPTDTEGVFEKAMEMAWRLLVDQKPLRQVLGEIGVNPEDYLEAPAGSPSGDVRRTGQVSHVNRAFLDGGQEPFTPGG